MDNPLFSKARLTIQDFVLPTPRRECSSGNQTLTKKSSLIFLNYNPERRLQLVQQDEAVKLKKSLSSYNGNDQFLDNLMSLPEIRAKSHSVSNDKLNRQDNFRSHGSAKLFNKNRLRQEQAKTFRLSKAANNGKNGSQSERILKVNHLQNHNLNHPSKEDRPIIFSKEKLSKKTFHFTKLQKNHLNRLKNQQLIPQQLLTQGYGHKFVDDTNLNLQMKNVLRFKFDSAMEGKRRCKEIGVKQSRCAIQGWAIDKQMYKDVPYDL